MTATCSFVCLGDKMCELLVKKWKKKRKKRGKEKRKIIDHMTGLKKGAKFSRCVAVFHGEAE